jgi:hypothetical protein
MKIGAKVRLKAEPEPSDLPMTVQRVTPQGYIVCLWLNPATRVTEERMFFAEMLEEYTEPLPRTKRERH